MSGSAAPLLSVIMPVFNSARTLEDSISSVLCQTFHDLELIVVDDGSTDSSLEICKSFEVSDSRVTIIRKQNGGASSARNAGLAIARGKYVTFIDADDTIELRAYEEVLNCFHDQTVDLVVFGMKVVSLLGDRVVNVRLKGIAADWSDFTGRNDPIPFFQLLEAGLLMSANNKVYRRIPIEERRFRFDEASAIMEDFGFVLDYLSIATRVKVVAEAYYHYYIDISGSTLSRRPDIDYVRNFGNLEKKLWILAGQGTWLSADAELQLRRIILRNYLIGGDFQMVASGSASERRRRTRTYFGSPPFAKAAKEAGGLVRSEKVARRLALDRRFALLTLFLDARRARSTLSRRLVVLRTRFALNGLPRMKAIDERNCTDVSQTPLREFRVTPRAQE